PEIWQRSKAAGASAPSARLGDIFRGSLLPLTIAVTLMNACTMFAWWGFNLWIPAYLSLPESEGGVGLSTSAMSGLVIAMQVGMWFGYVTFGFVSDVLGRKRTYLLYLLTAAVLVFLYGTTRHPLALLILGPFVAFFGTGYFSGFGAVSAEIYPTAIRASAQGFTYNIGRVASAAAPFAVGSLAQTEGFGVALSLASIAFLLAAAAWIWIPETRGRTLA
ncbi:MAG TPA: MFS transporter, partial [Vicinamibacterales bacterium]|nr:MFS transporter [Vicinamibacterales bacterium]